MIKQNLLTIVGPTAVGKSSFGINLAKKYNGEIISGDSMQVYKNLNIGTAKVTDNEMQGIPHHMIDFLDVNTNYSVAMFKEQAIEIIKKINNKNKLPILVGGTGLYVQSLIDNYNFIPLESSQKFRNDKLIELEEYGSIYLHNKLIEIDPSAAKNIHPNDTKRIIRALEIYHISDGDNKTKLSNKLESPYNFLIIGLTMEREHLYSTINNRVDQMIEKGLIEEARELWKLNLPPNFTAMQGIGYKELFPYFLGELSLDSCIEILKRNTRRFAKRQLTWFRKDSRIIWFNVTNLNFDIIMQEIDKLIAGKFNL